MINANGEKEKVHSPHRKSEKNPGERMNCCLNMYVCEWKSERAKKVRMRKTKQREWKPMQRERDEDDGDPFRMMMIRF